MSDTLWRMAWALPLVLAVGILSMFLIRRAMTGMGLSSGPANPMSHVQSLRVSDSLQAHLLSVGGQSVLVVESGTQPVVHVLTAPTVPKSWTGALGGRRP